LPQLTRLERRDADMVLDWDDGTKHVIAYEEIRHACPCASCSPLRNGDDSSIMLRQNVENLPQEKPKVKPIGKYAISFEWNQGCSSGIYRFERLWKLGEKQDPDGGKTYVHGAW
jgi:DUF971 family protein|tara:strand:+ start:47 stop:388 length:342 start_codon:yes stop_codon:yes gene_type:complete